jgi:hypothetical protein
VLKEVPHDAVKVLGGDGTSWSTADLEIRVDVFGQPLSEVPETQ